ncbi:hypothetical protein QAD02_013695 [Eretmocerus hayati]|uniref:Uncharacterized protein n=1 Tax=Eretmocerus hayati TaxID=131215 RepID=A0ACC2P465_9HYME|nr:hypothetical protein QAD02_013695 [Eretmocerus hayati]
MSSLRAVLRLRKASPTDVHRDLYNAIAARDLPRVIMLLEQGADVNKHRGCRGRTCFLESLYNQYAPGDLDIVGGLVGVGANVAVTDFRSNTCLHIAAESDHSGQITLMLLNVGASAVINHHNEEGFTPLHVTLLAKHCTLDSSHRCSEFTDSYQYILLRNLIVAGVDASFGPRTNRGYGSLYTSDTKAVKYKRKELARNLLRHKIVDVNFIGSDKTSIDEEMEDWSWLDKSGSALHIAAGNGYMSITRILLEHGANPNLVNGEGLTPVQLIAMGSYKYRRTESILQLLREHGANINMTTMWYFTPLQIALTESQDFHTVKYFVDLYEQGLVHYLDEPLLHYAVTNENCGDEINTYLIYVKNHCVNVLDTSRCTPLLQLSKFKTEPISEYDCASPNSIRARADILLDAGANVQAVSEDGVSVLESAVKYNNLQVLQSLCKYYAVQEMRFLTNASCDVSYSNFMKLYAISGIKKFYSDCLTELEIMCLSDVTDRATIFSILSRNVTLYGGDNYILEQFNIHHNDHTRLLNKFPLYHESIKRNFQFLQLKNEHISIAAPHISNILPFGQNRLPEIDS